MDKALKTMTLDYCGSGKHKISPEKLLETKDAIFLDLRDEHETRTVSINLELFGLKTVTIPIDQLPDRLDELPKDMLIACFCSSGSRSSWAYIYLFSKGYNTKLITCNLEDFTKLIKPGRILKATK